VSTLVGALIGALLAGGGAAGTAPSESKLAPLASEATRERVQEQLADLANPVRLVVFTRQIGDTHLSERAAELAGGLGELSPKVTAEVYDLDAHEEKAEAYGADRAPAIIVVGEKDHGVRFYGVPGGGELGSLLAAIQVAAARDSGLSEASRKALAGLTRPAHIEVFVTLDCPHCPKAVEMAHRLAVESERVSADMVEYSAFRDHAAACGVRSVPTVLVNGQRCFEGNRPEQEFVAAVVKAASGE